ncbi:hypothetical protein BDV33DRAFT_164805 [Aspergillus novoparasiticus]|uniref:Uncharacterized protein n=1 Tax=Aspergillus novoparasiticus TaxID=986946 RepID=A0A5N6F595_9EURO|nr:hypothetical protein BDV33DRAFT_164805 [Aspergillus novoparasiticus]
MILKIFVTYFESSNLMIHLHFRQINNGLPSPPEKARKFLIGSWITLVILTTVGDSRYGVPWIREFCSTNLIDSPDCVRSTSKFAG